MVTKDDKELAKATKAAETKAKKEEEATAKLNVQAAQKELEAKHAAEKAALKAAEEAEEAAKPVSKSKAEFKKIMEAYKKQNPVKYELKKAEFDRKLAALK